MKYGWTKLLKGIAKNGMTKYPSRTRQTLQTGVTWWITQGEYEDLKFRELFFNMYEMNARDLRISSAVEM
jgi:hypothetical protein